LELGKGALSCSQIHRLHIPVNSTPDDTHSGFLIALARAPGCSRLGQFLAAVLVASISGGTAYLLWQNGDRAGFILTNFIFLYVVIYGARKTLELLPIPAGVRQAWVRRKDFYTFVVFVCFVLVAPFCRALHGRAGALWSLPPLALPSAPSPSF